MKVKYSITNLPEILPPDPIVRVYYTKESAQLTMYVIRNTYRNLANNYVDYATSNLGGSRERCNPQTREAFARTYLLLLSLISHGMDVVKVGDIRSVVNVSDNVMTKILYWLQSTFLIYVDNSEWKADIRKAKAGKTSVCFHAYRYGLREYPDFLRYRPERCKVSQRDDSDFDTEHPSRDKKLTRVVYENIPQSWGIYFNEWKGVLKEAEELIRVNASTNITTNDNGCLSPYSALVLDFAALARIKKVSSRIKDGVIKWSRNYYKPPIFKAGRWYHIFHQTPRELRGYLLYRGTPLVEAFDMHNAFYSLMLFVLKGHIPNVEYQKYRALVKTGRFYEDVQQKTGIGSRDLAKELLQKYRNCTIRQVQAKAHTEPDIGKIDTYFAAEFPNIRNFLDTYPRANGSKKLQADMCQVECNVFQPICEMLLNCYHLTPFSLHDGIYLSEADNQRANDLLDWSRVEDLYVWSKV